LNARLSVSDEPCRKLRAWVPQEVAGCRRRPERSAAAAGRARRSATEATSYWDEVLARFVI
jgi:hypothetical protein